MSFVMFPTDSRPSRLSLLLLLPLCVSTVASALEARQITRPSTITSLAGPAATPVAECTTCTEGASFGCHSCTIIDFPPALFIVPPPATLNQSDPFNTVSVTPHVTVFPNGTRITNFETQTLPPESQITDIATWKYAEWTPRVTGSTFTVASYTLTVGKAYSVYQGGATVTWHSILNSNTATVTNPAQCSKSHTFTAEAPINTILGNTTARVVYDSIKNSMLTADAISHGWQLNQNLSTCFLQGVPAPGVQVSATYLTHVTADPVVSTVSAEPETSPSTTPAASSTPDQPTAASTRASAIPVSAPTPNNPPAPSSTSPPEQPAPINPAPSPTPEQNPPPTPPKPTPQPENPPVPASPPTSNPPAQAPQPPIPAPPISSIVVGDSTIAISAAPSAVVIGGSVTVSRNQVATVGGLPISVPSSGAAVVIGSSTIDMGSAIMCQFGQTGACPTASVSITNAGTYPTIAVGAASSTKTFSLRLWGLFGAIATLICII